MSQNQFITENGLKLFKNNIYSTEKTKAFTSLTTPWEKNSMISRITALIILILLSPLLVLISLIIIVSDGFPFLVEQKRVGRKNTLFIFYKFRTMKRNTPVVATRLLSNSGMYLIRGGKFLRRFSIDELPNLINVFKGEMKFVGPRPALCTEEDLVDLRAEYSVDDLVPGITGWAQVNGRDALSVFEKVSYDRYYLENKSVKLDVQILFMTLMKTVSGQNVH